MGGVLGPRRRLLTRTSKDSLERRTALQAQALLQPAGYPPQRPQGHIGNHVPGPNRRPRFGPYRRRSRYRYWNWNCCWVIARKAFAGPPTLRLTAVIQS